MQTQVEKFILSELETEKAISILKEVFSKKLADKLQLTKVEAPLFVETGTGINDDLNGIETPVNVNIKSLPTKKVEIIHSLAKWKRSKIKKLQIEVGEGIYTDMKAIRADENMDDIHSILVDQWDWEKRISPADRNLAYLKETVQLIYQSFIETEKIIIEQYSQIESFLPAAIFFIHSEELLALYPELNSKEREHKITQKHGAVFIIGVGNELSNGEPHDGRAPDYDDWSSETTSGKKGLNGDILIWNPLLQKPIEISSMGIRVSPESLIKQLEISKQQNRIKLAWHQQLINEQLPYTIGGGIGQSRLAMLLLNKKHISEVQCSIWTDEILEENNKSIQIL
ncbi:MAG: aspartate--ammonia ligase [Flavobacteriia bacterium]|nr:aspartate--ammonia ligase [Flavobacteriia bacterium]